MSEKNKYPEIPEELQSPLSQLKAARGACPTSEELVQYQNLALPPAAMGRIREHIEDCGQCDWLVTSLKRFDAEEESELRAAVTRTAKSPGILDSIRFIFLKPAIAYLAVLALLYPAYRGIFERPRVVEKVVRETEVQRVVVGGAGTAREFNLGEGVPQRTATAPPRDVVHKVALQEGENFFVLNFFVPVRLVNKYEMEITDHNGKVVVTDEIRSRDRFGNFSLIGTRQQFAEGLYKLTIKEVEKSTGRLIDEYSFTFRVVYTLQFRQ